MWKATGFLAAAVAALSFSTSAPLEAAPLPNGEAACDAGGLEWHLEVRREGNRAQLLRIMTGEQARDRDDVWTVCVWKAPAGYEVRMLEDFAELIGVDGEREAESRLGSFIAEILLVRDVPIPGTDQKLKRGRYATQPVVGGIAVVLGAIADG